MKHTHPHTAPAAELAPWTPELPCPCCAGVYQLVQVGGAESALTHTLPACQGFAVLSPVRFVELAAAALLGPARAEA